MTARKHVLLAAGGLVLGSLLWMSFSSAQDEKKEADGDKMVLEVYQVKDLLSPPDAPLPRNLRPVTEIAIERDPIPSAVVFHEPPLLPPPDPRVVTTELLIDLIGRTVDPASWDGGAGIHAVATNLVVTQFPRNHREIKDLLGMLRKKNPPPRPMNVQAWWVILSDKQLPKIADVLPAPRMPGREVDLATLKNSDAEFVASGTTSCMEGQTVHIASGRGQTALVSWSPILDEYVVAAIPVVRMVFWGATLEVCVSLSDDGESARVDFGSVYSVPKELGAIDVGPGAVAASLPATSTAPALAPIRKLDRLDFHALSIRSSAHVPLNRPALVGGASFPEAKGKGLYLILMISPDGAKAGAKQSP